MFSTHISFHVIMYIHVQKCLMFNYCCYIGFWHLFDHRGCFSCCTSTI